MKKTFREKYEGLDNWLEKYFDDCSKSKVMLIIAVLYILGLIFKKIF
jgi:antibiotic biosynthesis monooxygenase (ABM) superfamily enzyme